MRGLSFYDILDLMSDAHYERRLREAEERLIAKPFEGRLNTPYGIHTHVCGYDHEDRNKSDQGCGFMFTHDGEVNRKLDTAAYDAVHKCPRCGAGPWRSVYKQDIIHLMQDFAKGNGHEG
jgi:hypothetical protein